MGTGLELSPDLNPSEILAHYGVKGMHWGQVKSDPTAGVRSAKDKVASAPSSGSAAKTLGDSAPSRKEVRQEKRDAKADLLGIRADKMDVRVSEIRTQLDSLPGGYKTYGQRSSLKNELNITADASASLRENADRIRAGKLTSTQKKLILGAVAATIIVGGVYGVQKAQSGELNSWKLQAGSRLRGQKFDFKRNDKLASYTNPDDVLAHVAKPVNPNYDKPGGAMNCRRSTYTYELRRRGYDVQATTSFMGWGQSETGAINALTKGEKNISRSDSLSANVVKGNGIRGMALGDTRINPAHVTSIPDANDRMSVLNALASQPPGARGEIVFDFKAFGHSLAYENFDGKPQIFDTQKGTKYDLSDPSDYESFVSKWSKSGGLRGAEITRLDNMELDNTFLSRWATNRAAPEPKPSFTPRPSSARQRRANQRALVEEMGAFSP